MKIFLISTESWALETTLLFPNPAVALGSWEKTVRADFILFGDLSLYVCYHKHVCLEDEKFEPCDCQRKDCIVIGCSPWWWDGKRQLRKGFVIIIDNTLHFPTAEPSSGCTTTEYICRVNQWGDFSGNWSHICTTLSGCPNEKYV